MAVSFDHYMASVNFKVLYDDFWWNLHHLDNHYFGLAFKRAMKYANTYSGFYSTEFEECAEAIQRLMNLENFERSDVESVMNLIDKYRAEAYNKYMKRN